MLLILSKGLSMGMQARHLTMTTDASHGSLLRNVRALSFDVTGTLLIHRDPFMESYADAAVWAKLPDPPSAAELKPAFRKAYHELLTESPCFGDNERHWWINTVKRCLENCGRGDRYTDEEFHRFFRRVYQHYGSPEGYELLPDAVRFLEGVKKEGLFVEAMGICTNTPARTVETVLPMNGLHDYFNWFVCCQDIGKEKPDKAIFDAFYKQALFWVPDLKRDEILHIGDNIATDYCAARRAGFQALHLDRSANPRVINYQDWIEAPDYSGKDAEDIKRHTVTSFDDVKELLFISNGV